MNSTPGSHHPRPSDDESIAATAAAVEAAEQQW